jgi:hypothetical protein
MVRGLRAFACLLISEEFSYEKANLAVDNYKPNNYDYVPTYEWRTRDNVHGATVAFA